MAVTEGVFSFPPFPASATDGKTVLTFDGPGDFVDYVAQHPDFTGVGWDWVGPVVSAN